MADIIKTLGRLNTLLSFSRPACKYGGVIVSCEKEESKCGKESAHPLTSVKTDAFALFQSFRTSEVVPVDRRILAQTVHGLAKSADCASAKFAIFHVSHLQERSATFATHSKCDHC